MAPLALAPLNRPANLPRLQIQHTVKQQDLPELAHGSLCCSVKDSSVAALNNLTCRGGMWLHLARDGCRAALIDFGSSFLWPSAHCHYYCMSTNFGISKLSPTGSARKLCVTMLCASDIADAVFGIPLLFPLSPLEAFICLTHYITRFASSK